MISVNSVRGGRSSTYMALHYPSDLYIYACVLTDDIATVIPDKSLRSYCQGKLPNHDWDKSANREAWQNLANMRQLEQLLGKEIIWVSAEYSFDGMLENHSFLPNSRARFCTTQLKIEPIYRYLYSRFAQGVIVNPKNNTQDATNLEPFYVQIGFRYGEEKRTDNQCLPIAIPSHCSLQGQKRTRWITTKNLRVSAYPLIENQVDAVAISAWANNSAFSFPAITDCDFCFFRTKSEIMAQTIAYPERAKWWLKWEEKVGATWSGKSTKKTSGGCACEL
jgi:hypothetical protein